MSCLVGHEILCLYALICEKSYKTKNFRPLTNLSYPETEPNAYTICYQNRYNCLRRVNPNTHYKIVLLFLTQSQI